MWDQLSLFVQPDRPYTVSEITSRIRSLLEQEPLLQSLWIEGEISNFSRASSGHIYLTLKDAGAQLNAVIWRSQVMEMSYLPHSGDQVIAHGRIGVYEQSGRYQLYIDRIRQAGRGSIYEEFERLKARLEAEGLFSEALKKPLPPYPKWIGVVTSPNAAALRDVLHVLERRYPLVKVMLSPTLVQGEAAPRNIIQAIDALNTRDEIDVILLVRGGGSLEDLWAFNDEAVARAVAASRLPIISGIGHETDFSLADFAADRRAPTPTAAAVIATPDIIELQTGLRQMTGDLLSSMDQALGSWQDRLTYVSDGLRRLSPQIRISNFRQRIDDLTGRLDASMAHTLKYERQHVGSLLARLLALDPEAVLARGYAIVRQHKSTELVTSVHMTQRDQLLDVQFHDGQVVVKVESPLT
jgi:exodeoxyribonuclease VII large subunit